MLSFCPCLSHLMLKLLKLLEGFPSVVWPGRTGLTAVYCHSLLHVTAYL